MVFIELYSKDDCPVCNNVKTMLKEKNITFKEYVLGQNITREEVKTKFPHARMVPIIVVDGVEVKEVRDFQLLLEG